MAPLVSNKDTLKQPFKESSPSQRRANKSNSKKGNRTHRSMHMVHSNRQNYRVRGKIILQMLPKNGSQLMCNCEVYGTKCHLSSEYNYIKMYHFCCD